MRFNGKFFQFTLGVIIILLIMLLLKQLDFFFIPLRKFFAVLFFPIFISGLFYYLLRPLIRWAEKIRIPRTLTIIIIFSLIIIALAWLGKYAGFLVRNQFEQLLNNLPQILAAGRIQTEQLLHTKNLGIIMTGQSGQSITLELQKALLFLVTHIVNTITAITGIATVLVLVPFILFYFLRDDAKYVQSFLSLIPESYQNEVKVMIVKSDQTLAAYIIGQVILAIVLGALTYLGYLIIGVHYPLILALFALVTSFIPIFGSIIGVIPALIIGLAENPWLVLKITIMAVLVHLFNSNLIFPHLIGKRLKIYPLTIILLFLVAASLFGIVGILVIVPVYAVTKIWLKSFIKLYQIHQDIKRAK